MTYLFPCNFTIFLIFCQTIAHGQQLDTLELRVADTIQVELEKTEPRRGAIKQLEPSFGAAVGIQYASQLLQGEVAGLIVARPGDNPNEDFLLRLRGMSTIFQRNSPLIVVDGMPDASLYLLAPGDIASMTVLKDAASAAKYGILGASGVIEVETKKSVELDLPRLSYHSWLSYAKEGRRIPMVSLEEFRHLRQPAVLFGSETNWIDEITRPALSHGHQLSASAKDGSLGYFASFGWREEEGVLKRSGFEQLNARLHLRQEAWKGRLVFSTQMAGITRKIDYSAPDAFEYAVFMNPTAPIHSGDPEFEEYGGYFQYTYNPVALIEQNVNIVKINQLSGNLKGELSITNNLKINAAVFLQQEHSLRGRYFHPQTNYVAYYGQGSIYFFDTKRFRRRWEMTASGHWKIKDLSINSRQGIASQYQKYQNYYESRDDLAIYDEPLNFNNLNDSWAEIGDPRTARDFQSWQKLPSIFTDLQLDWRALYVQAHVRRDGWEFRDGDTRHGWFYGITGGVRLGHLLLKERHTVNLRIGIGKTGGLPVVYNRLFIFGGQTETSAAEEKYAPFSNLSEWVDNIKWEEKKELNIGLDFSLWNKRLEGAVDIYDNLIVDGFYKQFDPNGSTTGSHLSQQLQLSNSGVELDLRLILLQKKNISWQTGLQFFANTTLIRQVHERREIDTLYFRMEGMGTGGIGGGVFILQENDQPPGQFFVQKFTGEATSTGGFTYEDPDGDGFPNYFVGGSGVPKVGINWHHHFKIGRFDLQVSFRSLIGHQLVNSYRVLGERLNYPYYGWNIVKTSYYREDITRAANGVNSYYIENASFVKLDCLTLGYHFPTKKCSFRLYASAQNLWTWTKYTGIDPEVRLESNGNAQFMGMERADTYLRAKIWTLGLAFEL